MEHSGALEWLGFSVARISNYIGVAAVLSLVQLIIIFLSLNKRDVHGLYSFSFFRFGSAHLLFNRKIPLQGWT